MRGVLCLICCLVVDFQLQDERVSLAELTVRTVAEDGNVTIPCGPETQTGTLVRWYKGDRRLQGSRYSVLPDGALHIQSVRMNNAGMYTCTARDRSGDPDVQISLVVRDRTRILSPPGNHMMHYERTVAFQCEAITDFREVDKLRYVWLKDGTEIDGSDQRYRTKGGDLIISNTTSADSGTYTCRATNDLDSDEASAILRVQAPPHTPTWVNVTSCDDSDVDMEWEYDDRQSNFVPLREFVLEFNTNHDPDLWVEAATLPAYRRRMTYRMNPWAIFRFRLRARNVLGISDPSEPTAECLSAPSRPWRNPENVHTVENRTGWLVIEWDPVPKLEHNGPDFRYEVTWQAEGDDEKNTDVITDWRENRYEVEVEGVYQPYIITVKAANALGDAITPPEPVKGFSGQGAPAVVPENFELDPEYPVTATGAKFRWDPVDTSPEAVRGKFKRYLIRTWKNGQTNATLHGGGFYTSTWYGKYTGVISLPHASEFKANVVVVNEYFSSNASNTVTFSTPHGAPTVVPENFELYVPFVNRGVAEFRWDSVNTSLEAMQGYLYGYVIRYWQKDQLNDTLRGTVIDLDNEFRYRTDEQVNQLEEKNDFLRRVTFPTDDQPFTIYQDGKIRGKLSNLLPFSEMQANVVVINTNFYASNVSNTVTFFTPEEVATTPSPANAAEEAESMKSKKQTTSGKKKKKKTPWRKRLQVGISELQEQMKSIADAMSGLTDLVNTSVALTLKQLKLQTAGGDGRGDGADVADDVTDTTSPDRGG